MRALGLDHVVLLSSDVDRSIVWYRDHLGLGVERLEEWRRGEVLFPSLRLDEATIIDVFAGERTGQNVDHVCLVVEGVDLDELAASDEFEVASGPSEVWGARGMGRSVYVRDPDGNTVELRTYPD
jgi:catechol 2,3-dioxygenase-like lactoylglutathione lyase family enzyme